MSQLVKKRQITLPIDPAGRSFSWALPRQRAAWDISRAPTLTD